MKNANLVSLAGCGLALLLAAGCGAKAPEGSASPKTVADYFVITVGDQKVRMQLAVSPSEMERGLMERRDLAPDEGMLFIYRTPGALSFWMHDTPTALDIGFFTRDGVLAEVYPLLPFDEKPVSARGREMKFALEMNQNWFRDNGLRPGSRLDLKALAAALKARDFEPRKFGLVTDLH